MWPFAALPAAAFFCSLYGGGRSAAAPHHVLVVVVLVISRIQDRVAAAESAQLDGLGSVIYNIDGGWELALRRERVRSLS